MRISFCVDPGRPWPDIVALAKQLDSTTWSCVYVCDHFVRTSHDPALAASGMLEAWTVLTGLAGVTSTVGLGTLVLANVNRHPAVVANMAATLDHVSGGRLVLGLGAGCDPGEHEAYGIELPSPPELHDRFDGACEVIVSLLTDPTTTFESPWYRLRDAACAPKPLQTKLPILVGGSSPRTMRTAARFADVWHVWGSPAELRRRNLLADAACHSRSRDPGSLRRASGALVWLDDGRCAPDGWSDADEPVVSGRPPAVADQIASYADAGIDEFIWRDHAMVGVSETLAQLAQFAADVRPHLD